MATAIITGGSSGLGLEFARELAARGINLVIVARGEQVLTAVCRDLSQQYHVKVRGVVADLSDPAAVEQVLQLISHTHDLAYFIGNAGFAIHLDMLDDRLSARQTHAAALQVMGLNVVLFSMAAAKVMRRQSGGHIINVASTACLTFQGHYSAIKSYVLSYSESLALSLRGSGVTVTAVCPSWMKTNFHRVAGLDEPAIPGWLYMRPEVVARAALRGAERGKAVVVPTARWKLLFGALYHGPVSWRRRFTTWYTSTSSYQRKSHRRKKREK